MLLAFHVGSPDNHCESVEYGIAQFEVLDESFKRASIAAMIQFHFGEARGIERSGIFFFGPLEHLILGHKDKFRGRINETADQPWACDAIDFDIASRNPFASSHQDFLGLGSIWEFQF